MACFGTSGTCRQFALDLAYQARGASTFAAYIGDDDPRSHHDDGMPIVSLDEIAGWDDIAVFVPVHDPAGRRSIFGRLESAGLPILGAEGLPHLSYPGADLGEGVIVSSTTRVGPSTRIGRGTLALSDLVAHDVTVGEFSTLAAHSIILGHVEIGRDAFIGAGAIIKNGTAARPVVIGDGAVVGAGAVVSGDVAAGETMVSPRAVAKPERTALGRMTGHRPPEAQ